MRLCLVTDENMYEDDQHLAHIILSAIAGGTTMVQLREKKADTRSMIRKGALLREILPKHVPFIINDRVDIALAVDADGVHLGQSDMPVAYARKLLGENKIIGLSVETKEHAVEANALPVDYIGLSPVFSTATKQDIATPLDLSGVKEITRISQHPSLGIGGITLSNVASVIKAGADGVAVVSYLMQASDPMNAAKSMKDALEEACS